MIVIDTSALIVIAFREPEQILFEQGIATARRRFLPVSCYLECVMVLSGRQIRRQWLDRYVDAANIELAQCDPTQARFAADAFERYGRGSGHAAKLNFGDCLAYAAAVALGAPLLFKGDDFALTDVQQALAAP